MPKGKINKAKVQQLFFRAYFEPSTYNEDERTIEVVFATDTPVRRYDWLNDRYFDEVLSFVPGHVRTDRLSAGAPLLNDHSLKDGVNGVLGVVESHRFVGNTGRAVVRFSERAEIQTIVHDIRDGILRNISCGYRVFKYDKELEEGKEIPIYRAVDWEPVEISIVPIPADPASGVRSLSADEQRSLEEVELTGEEPIKQRNNSQFMNKEQIIAMLLKRGIVVDANISDEALQVELERSLGSPAPNPAPPANPSPGVNPEALQAGIDAERKRSNDITLAVRSAKLDQKFADDLIARGVTADEARTLVIAEFAKEDPLSGTRSQNTTVGADNEAIFRRQAIEASLVLRADRDLVTDKNFNPDAIVEAKKSYRGMTLLDIAKDCLVRGGVDVSGLDKMEIVGRAITSSSSDFPVLLEGTNRRILLANYAAVADTWRRFAITGNSPDFRENKRLRMGSFSDLDKVEENGEFKNKKISDADFERLSVDTKGNIINVSRKMIINDDLNAFSRLSSMLGRAAARSIENDVYALLAENAGLGPLMVDGKTLFHADHGNIVTTAAAPTVTVIDLMRQQMAIQKEKDGNDFLDIRPELLLAPLSLGSTLRVLNSAEYDVNVSNKFQVPNVVRGLFKDVIDTPRLSGTAYYAFANPTEEPVIEVAFLNGEQSPYMESKEGWSVDGMEWKVRLDYGVGAIGYRGALRNAGA